jgi:hypothetical protein
MTIQICPSCNGTKKVIGMGTIVKDCAECNGVGKIDVAINDPKPAIVEDSQVKPIAKKKPGRPFAKKSIVES